MYFTDDSLLPENMPPLMITAAPYGPMWMPEDCTPEQKLPVTWDDTRCLAGADCRRRCLRRSPRRGDARHCHCGHPAARPHPVARA